MERVGNTDSNPFRYIETKITIHHINDIDRNGFTIIDDIFDPEHAETFLQELKGLAHTGLLQPNRTHFASSTVKGQYSLYSKPGIYEVDFHQPELRGQTELMEEFFNYASQGFISCFQKHMKAHLLLGNSSRTLKVQWNKGKGACFPLHYDNPGPPNNRCLTCIIYFNKDWSPEHQGEITLYPFLREAVKIPPIFNRMVVFSSNSICHRVEPSWRDRYCFTVWIDGEDTNSRECVELRLPPSAMSNLPDTILMLQSTPLQRSLSRAVYREEYELSLIECMGNALGGAEMLAYHRAYCAGVERNKPLFALIEALRDWKAGNVDGKTTANLLEKSTPPVIETEDVGGGDEACVKPVMSTGKSAADAGEEGSTHNDSTSSSALPLPSTTRHPPDPPP